MAAPVVKGLIITASVLVAAGIAFYENEHIREFILTYRRKLAIALHSLGDDISPSSRSPTEDDEAAAGARRRRREEIVRLNRLDMIRQAREEGIAVDLDELVKLGEAEATKPLNNFSASSPAERHKGFDALISADGTLRQQNMSQATGAEGLSSGMRQRGAGARGLDAGTALANPFDDESQVMSDRELVGNSILSEKSQQSRESTRTLSPAPIESSITGSQYYSEDEMEAQIEEAIRRSMHDQTMNRNPATQSEGMMNTDPPKPVPSSTESSYYYAPPPNVGQPPANAQSMYSSVMEAMMQANLQSPLVDDVDEEAPTPSGTLTPTEDGQSTAASFVGSQAEDIGRMGDFHSMDDDIDTRSETMSEAFSMVGGVNTPGSWTDVESEAGDEDGHQSLQPAQISQFQ